MERTTFSRRSGEGNLAIGRRLYRPHGPEPILAIRANDQLVTEILQLLEVVDAGKQRPGLHRDGRAKEAADLAD